MNIVNWINRTIKHNRDDEGDYGIRVIIHIPVGFLIGLFFLSEKLFLRYEVNEDRNTKDEAWKDIAGAMIGFVPGRILAFTIIGALIYRMIIIILACLGRIYG